MAAEGRGHRVLPQIPKDQTALHLEARTQALVSRNSRFRPFPRPTRLPGSSSRHVGKSSIRPPLRPQHQRKAHFTEEETETRGQRLAHEPLLVTTRLSREASTLPGTKYLRQRPNKSIPVWPSKSRWGSRAWPLNNAQYTGGWVPFLHFILLFL